ncbi:serine-rich adhesin for platelets isoform X1 [Drosophila innubila]|uniref:serine-rich adhesin for platelets isoform X1 n=1 Tax=Drosophila innubila TaxID=198719 RepID=UPI00148D8BA6|nr:serine-rich adhesin for platelets isoform X1 [Drosophila innubila]
MPTTTKTATKSSAEEEEEENCDTLTIKTTTTRTAMPITGEKPQSQSTSQSAASGPQPASDAVENALKMPAPTSAPTARPTPTPTLLPLLASAAACNKQLLFCRRFKDASAGAMDGAGFLRNFNSLPLFVYATSPSTHASSADGVGVAREAAAAAATAFTEKNEGFEFPATHGTCKTDGSCISQHRIGNNNNNNNNHSSNYHSSGLSRVTELASGAMECLPMSSGVVTHHPHPHPHLMATSGAGGGAVVASPTATVVVGATYPHHLHHHHHHLSHHAPYSNSYGSHPHHPIHSEQTKSLQELQHEVGALLEFRDLVIETFPDLKHKMASMSATPSTPNSVGAMGGSHSVGGVGGSSSLAARREWEPGIRMKRKLSHKEPSTTTTAATAASAAGAEPSSSSLTRSRSNSHSGKKEPKSGENNNGSVVQDSGFSTETSSSKEGHSASSTNGAMTVAIASNRLSCAESDDELLNLLDVIHRKSNRLREEVEQLQSYERQQGDGVKGQKTASGMTPQQFREQVDRLNREDIKQLRKERDRLLDKLAEMEAETLTGRIKAAKMNDQVEELISVKKDLEEQLKLAMAQKLELSSRVQQLQLQQQQQLQQSKSSSSASQSDFSSQRNFSSSATTVLSNSSRPSLSSTNNTFQPVVLEQPQSQSQSQEAFHQSSVISSDNATARRQQQQQQQGLGRLDGVVSTPGARNTKCRITDSKRFSAILLETNVLELQRHLLTLTVQNQVLAQKLDSSSKSKTQLAKRLDKSQEDSEELRFQLEEKNIELEGTKAQLRVLESRLHTSSSTNSYLNSSSQHDYETNRSSASTTLMLSRRGVPDSVDSTSATVTAAASTALPRSDQISTPSMKAMVPLAMDELQQHSSSTESAHEHEPEPQSQSQSQSQSTPNDTQSKTIVNSPLGSSTPTAPSSGSSIAARVMSSSYEQTPQRSYAFRKFSSASKPSKIPLPGSKAAAYFAGKPPTGRASTAGRSPPSVHNSSSVSYGSKSSTSLSRSTGNLNQSLKRADSASNHSLSTNTSRSSTSSSIPLATTPYSSSNRSSHTTTTTPSPRVLQNSPLPKLKRETLSSRVRHLDSLSRAQQSPEQQLQQQQQQLNNSSASRKSSPSSGSSSSIAAQLSSTLRKDLQLSASSVSASSYHRRGTVPGSAGVGVARRFSSASVAGARLAREQHASNEATASATATPTSSYGDSDSGKPVENCN